MILLLGVIGLNPLSINIFLVASPTEKIFCFELSRPGCKLNNSEPNFAEAWLVKIIFENV